MRARRCQRRCHSEIPCDPICFPEGLAGLAFFDANPCDATQADGPTTIKRSVITRGAGKAIAVLLRSPCTRVQKHRSYRMQNLGFWIRNRPARRPRRLDQLGDHCCWLLQFIHIASIYHPYGWRSAMVNNAGGQEGQILLIGTQLIRMPCCGVNDAGDGAFCSTQS